MKTPQAAIRDLQDELSHVYQRIDFRAEKYNNHSEEWKNSENGVMYLEETTRLALISVYLQKKINNIDPSHLNPFI